MWYFAWIVGLAFACAAAILNALWYELDRDKDASKRLTSRRPSAKPR